NQPLATGSQKPGSHSLSRPGLNSTSPNSFPGSNGASSIGWIVPPRATLFVLFFARLGKSPPPKRDTLPQGRARFCPTARSKISEKNLLDGRTVSLIPSGKQPEKRPPPSWRPAEKVAR